MLNNVLELDNKSIQNRRNPVIEYENSSLLTHEKNFVCHFCSKKFKSELVFMKHTCEQKRRHSELHSPLGQLAYNLYRDWMKLRKFREQSSSAFLDSRFYRSFINFAKLVQTANITKPDRYMQLMVSNDIQPPLWCRNSAYSIYLDWVDLKSDPLEEVQLSIELLISLSEKHSRNLIDIFDVLGSQEILNLIRKRQLTPWLLFHSKRFGNMLRTLSREELKAFNAVVNASYWADKFQKNKELVKNIKLIISEMDL